MNACKYIPFCTLVASATLLVAPAAHATTYYVATTGNNANPGTLAQPFLTITHAVAVSVHGDSIQVAAGTYSESFTIPGTNLNLTGAGAATTIINGSIQTSNGFVLTMSGFTVQNGLLQIFNMACNLSDCIFKNNSPSGLILQTNSFVNVNNCTFSNNSSGISGGGNPSVTNCTFTSNTSSGINLSSGSPNVSNCTFTSNSNVGPGGGGGGMRCGSGVSTVTNCTFMNNNGGGNGGGLLNTSNSANVTNCLFIGNTGAAILNSQSSPKITNCTFSGNSGGPVGSGGIFSFTGNPIVTNCILWGDVGMEIVDNGGASTTVTYSNVSGADPLFVNPGGANYRLQAGSPCIDAGNNTAVGVGTDLAGKPRILNSIVDMGAYEFVPSRVIVAWRSVRAHTGAGNLSIALNPTASGNGSTGPTAEPRQGGVQRIELDFNGPVTLANSANVTVTGRTTTSGVMGGPVAYVPNSVSLLNPSTLQILFNAGVLPDKTCCTITLAPSLLAEVLTGDLDVSVRSLVGDTSSSGGVNLSDAISTKSRIGQPVAVNPQHDVNLSGDISIADALLVKSLITKPPKQALCP